MYFFCCPLYLPNILAKIPSSTTIRFFFQPAEEGPSPGGALPMIAAGMLKYSHLEIFKFLITAFSSKFFKVY